MIKLLVAVCILSGSNNAACFELASTSHFESMKECTAERDRMVSETWALRMREDMVANARCVAELGE